MEVLTFAKRRGPSAIESRQKKENKDTDASRFAGLFVGSLKCTN